MHQYNTTLTPEPLEIVIGIALLTLGVGLGWALRTWRHRWWRIRGFRYLVTLSQLYDGQISIADVLIAFDPSPPCAAERRQLLARWRHNRDASEDTAPLPLPDHIEA